MNRQRMTERASKIRAHMAEFGIVARVGLPTFAPILISFSLSVVSDQGSTPFGNARGRGREAGCPAPPAQIPACSTNAPSSSLRSNVGR